MNQQEIDRLWDECKTPINYGMDGWDCMLKSDFALAAAEIRRQAFLEAAKVCDAKVTRYQIASHVQNDWCYEQCAESIRALAQSEQEKS